jgi:hypothetical protein
MNAEGGSLSQNPDTPLQNKIRAVHDQDAMPEEDLRGAGIPLPSARERMDRSND